MLDDAGTCDLAVFGDMADQDHRGAAAFGEADQFAGRAAHLCHRAGRGFDGLRPHRLDRVDDEKPRRRALRHCRDNIFDRGFGGDFETCLGKAHTLSAQPHLSHGFFAGDIDRALLVARKGCGDIEKERRFADAGIAAEKDDRAAHQAAAGDAVELGDAGRDSRRLVARRRLQGLNGEDASLARAAFGPSPPSSTSVFHSPQASHLPAQRENAAPQFWQMKLCVRAAIVLVLRPYSSR